MLKKIFKYIFIFVWFVYFFTGIVVNTKYSFGDYVVAIILMFLPIILIYAKKIVKAKKLAKVEKQINEKIEYENEKINNLQTGLPVLNIPSLFLGNAKLHYYEPAVLLYEENKMVGLINESTKDTRRLASFFNSDYEQYKSKSTGISKAVYEDISYHYHGELAITSKSIIFINQEKGFEIKVNDIAFVQEYSNGVSIQNGDDVYLILIDEPRYFIAILNTLKNDL